jgi:hypothetical protein
MPRMSDWPTVIALILVAAVPVALIRAYAGVSNELLAGWARAHAVELTAENRPVLARYLRTGRVLRTWGVVCGLLLPSVVELVFSGRVQLLGFGTDGTSAPYAGPIGAFVGYLVGALCAELSIARRVDPARRLASVVPRELGQYLPRGLLYAQRALGIAVLLGALALVAVPFDRSAGAVEPHWLVLLTFGGAFAVFAVGLEALERWVVRRPQPFTSPSLVAADDAIRAQSVHSLAGSGLALLLVASSGTFFGLATSDVAVLRATMWLPAIVTLLLAIRACMDVGHRPWRVRRPVPSPTGARPA